MRPVVRAKLIAKRISENTERLGQDANNLKATKKWHLVKFGATRYHHGLVFLKEALNLILIHPLLSPVCAYLSLSRPRQHSYGYLCNFFRVS